MIRDLLYRIQHARQQARLHQQEQRDAELRLLKKMNQLGHQHPLSLLSLVRNVQMSTSELINLLDGLARRGLVEDVSKPHATSSYCITDAGRHMLHRDLAAAS
jgi:hypothetical protein